MRFGILIRMARFVAYYVRTFLLLMILLYIPCVFFLSNLITENAMICRDVLYITMIIAGGWTLFSTAEQNLFSSINKEDAAGSNQVKTIYYWLSIILIAMILSAITWLLVMTLAGFEMNIYKWILLILSSVVNGLFFLIFRWKKRIQSI